MALLTYLSDGTAEGLDLQVRRFVDSLRDAELQLSEACLRGDFSALRTGAHRLLGQSRMIGCTSLTEAATRLEAAAQTGDAAACREGLGRVREKIQSVKEAMRRPRPAAQPA
jgi:HPt (histidine-containing phosphotransfer) domain-containing protein